MRLQAVALALLALLPLAASLQEEGATWVLVRYAGPVAAEDRDILFAHADVVADPVPPFGYLAKLSWSDRAALTAREAVADIVQVPLAGKLSRDLAPQTRDVRVLVFPGDDAVALAARVRHAGAASAVAHPALDLVDVGLGALTPHDLAALAEVRWIEPLRDRAELDNARASSLVQSGALEAWTLHDRGVNGSSQIVAYCDTGLDTDAPLALAPGRTVHEMFADPAMPLAYNVPSPLHRKVALYYSPVDAGGLRGDFDDPDAHGTHVAGTIAGDAGAWGERDGHDGVAFAARLAVCDVANSRGFHVLADYSGYWAPAYDVGARVHSNSWGTSGDSNEYSLVARQHDAYAWKHRDFLILRSAGNTGPDGFLRPEALAKNVLAIGATANEPGGAVWGFSGRGPASDGRIKPDLVAPGDCLTSASIASPTAYVCVRGTSQATPVVAGAAALIRDHFAKGFYPSGSSTPADARHVSSALVRAVLVASAQPVAAASPDGSEGWGQPRLERALAYEGGSVSLFVHDEETPLETDEAWTTTIDVAEGASLRVVLAWTDHPASPGAPVALVNDLDLELVAPGGAVLLGNADLAAPDRTNVIERAVLTDAAPGTYTLRVRGWNVPMGPQPFGLVAAVLV